MALIKCPDCSKEFSTKATACPQCGCPVAAIESPSAQTALPTPTTKSPPANAPQSINPRKLSPETLGCVVMLVCFFLPWAQFAGANASAFVLQKYLGSWVNLVWLIPISAAITIVAGYYGKNQKALSQLTGGLPFLGLAYGLAKFGEDWQQLFNFLAIGAYLTLITGAALLSFVPRMKK